MSRPKQPENRFTPEWWAEHTKRDEKTGCHIWTGYVCKDGYGRVSRKDARGNQLTHRIAYEQAHGLIPRKGMVVRHSCDNPTCVNPAHLFLGTQRDNMHDMFKKGRGRPFGAPQWANIRLRPAETAVLSSSLAPEKARKCVGDINLVHHMRTPLTPPAWCRVIGGPSPADWADVPESRRPQWMTTELPQNSEPVSSQRDSAAELSSVSSSLRRSESGQ